MIPPIVHTFWKGPPCEIVEACFRRMRAINPTWDVRIHTTFDDADECPGFERLSIQHKVDWLRLCLVAKIGGVWLDATTVCVDKLEEWLDVKERRVVGFASPIPGCENVLENWAFAARPLHPLILTWQQEFASAIQMGFEAYKKFHIAEVGTHSIQDHMPYLSMHGAYVRVHDAQQVSMVASCDTKMGPFAYVCSFWGPNSKIRWIPMVRMMLTDMRHPPLLKMTGCERNCANLCLNHLPILPNSFMHRTLNLPPRVPNASVLAFVLFACCVVVVLARR